MSKIFKLPKAHCNQCGYTWTPRLEVIGLCPHCKSPYFDQPKKEKGTTPFRQYRIDGGELSYRSWRNRNKELRIEKEKMVTLAQSSNKLPVE